MNERGEEPTPAGVSSPELDLQRGDAEPAPEKRAEGNAHFGYFAQWSEFIARRRRRFQTAGRLLQRRAGRVGIQLGFFCGLFTMMWTLTHLDPTGDAFQSLSGLLLFAIPVAFIAPDRQRWHKLLNALFVASYWVTFALCTRGYFFGLYRLNHSIRWFLTALAMLSLITWFSLRPRQRSAASAQAEQSSDALWLGGCLIALAALITERYEMVQGVEPNTANILSGFTFLLFLTLACIRVLWLDGIRWYRAKRTYYAHPEDYAFFLEWLIPRSLAFLSILALLLLSEALFFSAIYRTKAQRVERERSQRQQMEQLSPLINYPDAEARDPLSTLPIRLSDQPIAAPRPPMSRAGHPGLEQAAPLQPRLMQGTVSIPTPSFGEWAFFAFKPYIFPKNVQGIEVDAPDWFKYLGRFLLGFVIAILLSQQLRLWRDIRAIYLSLLNSRRRSGLLRAGEAPGPLWGERLRELGSIFDVHALGWRWLILRATVAPLSPERLTQRLWWRTFFDPGGVFYEFLEYALYTFKKRWHLPLFGVSLILSLICAPLTGLYMLPIESLLEACLPALSAGLLIYFLARLFDLRAPTSYQRWLWWLLLVHLFAALVLFFLVFNLGARDQTSWWQNAFWILELSSVVVFPVLYLLGGDRHRHLELQIAWDEPQSNDHEVILRRALLKSFTESEHRLWLAQTFTEWLHPLRGGGLRWRLIYPSLLLTLHESSRALVRRVSAFLERVLNELLLSTTIWLSLQLFIFSVTLLSHLLVRHGLLVSEIFQLYLIAGGILLSPTFALFAYLAWRFSQARREAPGTPLPLMRRTLSRAVLAESRRLSILLWLSIPLSLGGCAWLLQRAEVTPSWTVLSFVLLFAPPWFPLRSLKTHREGEGGQGRERFEARLLRWLSRGEQWVQERQEELKTTIYEQAAARRQVEPLLAEALVDGCVSLIESLYQSLRDGRWQRAEQASIQRVYHQWLTGESESEELRLQRELLELYQQLLDTLGANLHDLTLSQSRAPHLLIQDPLLIVEGLTRICRCPNPLELSFDEDEDEEREDLRELISSLHILADHLLDHSLEGLPPPLAAQLSTPELRRALIELSITSAQLLSPLPLSVERLASLYERERESRLLLTTSLLWRRESAALLAPLAAKLGHELRLVGLPIETLRHGLHMLPSPIALPLERWLRVRLTADRELAPSQESGLAFRAFYQSSLAFFFVAIQERWRALSEMMPPHLSLRDRSAATQSLSLLRRQRPQEEELRQLIRHCLATFPSGLPLLDEGEWSARQIERGEAQLPKLLTALEAAELPTPLWRSAPSLDRLGYPRVCLHLRGITPQKSPPPEHEKFDRFELGGSLLLAGVRARPQLEFYSALWALQQLNELICSESLFYTKGEVNDALAAIPEAERPKDEGALQALRAQLERHHQRARIDQLEALTRRLRVLIPLLSPEEERILQRHRAKLYESLQLLKYLKDLETQRPSAGGANFQRALQ
ncbi:MAG: hypothetical protein VYD19_11190, partial [Myxococcota bacterium]|nr:hypothetical protein [Myxococcota bacterium]